MSKISSAGYYNIVGFLDLEKADTEVPHYLFPDFYPEKAKKPQIPHKKIIPIGKTPNKTLAMNSLREMKIDYGIIPVKDENDNTIYLGYSCRAEINSLIFGNTMYFLCKVENNEQIYYTFVPKNELRSNKLQQNIEKVSFKPPFACTYNGIIVINIDVDTFKCLSFIDKSVNDELSMFSESLIPDPLHKNCLYSLQKQTNGAFRIIFPPNSKPKIRELKLGKDKFIKKIISARKYNLIQYGSPSIMELYNRSNNKVEWSSPAQYKNRRYFIDDSYFYEFKNDEKKMLIYQILDNTQPIQIVNHCSQAWYTDGVFFQTDDYSIYRGNRVLNIEECDSLVKIITAYKQHITIFPSANSSETIYFEDSEWNTDVQSDDEYNE